MSYRILIIGEIGDDVQAFADALAQEFTLSLAPTVLDAGKRLQKEVFALIILDVAEGDGQMTEILRTLQQMSPSTPILVTSSSPDAAGDRRCRQGRGRRLHHPPLRRGETAGCRVRRALEARSLKNEIDYLRREQDVVYDTERIISVSPAMQKAMASIRRLAQTESTILITGETGTGKSFVSGNIHFNSPRRHKPFVKVNCANIPETLLESELFGHERGAFTGADKTRAGRFEQAHGGTLFLDEFCELSFGLQSKLLRVLEDKILRASGRQQDHPVRRARHRRHQPRHRGAGRPGPLPRRPLLPHQRAADPPAAAARAPGGHRTPGPLSAGQALPLA